MITYDSLWTTKIVVIHDKIRQDIHSQKSTERLQLFETKMLKSCASPAMVLWARERSQQPINGRGKGGASDPNQPCTNGIQEKGHSSTTVKIVAGEIVFQVNAKDKDDSLNMYWSSCQTKHHQPCINYCHSLWAVLVTAIIIFSHCYFHNYAH